MERVLPFGNLVASVRGPGPRSELVLATDPAGQRSAAVGPRQREEGARIPGEGTATKRGSTWGNGRREIRDSRKKRDGTAQRSPFGETLRCANPFALRRTLPRTLSCAMTCASPPTPYAHVKSSFGRSRRSAVP